MNSTMQSEWPECRRVQRLALLIGGIGLVVCALGAIFDLDQFLHSYLMAFMSCLGIALGSLAIWMIHNLTGGHWGFVIRRFLEAAVRTLPLLLLAFLPIALGLPRIYSWADLAGSTATAEQISRAHYLNVPFFLARAGVYFASWLVLAFLLDRWSRQQDQSADPGALERMQTLSGPGLIVYGLTVTFAAVDWVMSLDPNWSSTIFGAIVATGQMLPALGLAIALATWSAGRPALYELATADVWNDLGNLLLAFVMLWTYMMFSQLILIWSGNLPEEISWYLIRCEGGWQFVAVVLALFYFAFPFLFLLFRALKRDPRRLRLVALAVVGMSAVHQFWMVAPVFSPRRFSVHWLDAAALAGLGGLWLACCVWQLQARPLAPLHIPAPEEVPHHA